MQKISEQALVTRSQAKIPLNRHFYRYEPPQPLEIIEGEILERLQEVAA